MSPVFLATRRWGRRRGTRFPRTSSIRETIERVEVVDRVRHPPDELTRALRRLHLRRFGRLAECARPPGKRREELLAIDSPGVAERDLRAARGMQPVEVEAQQLLLPRAAILDR